MPEGRMVRSDDITAERLSLEATKKVNAEQVAALISEDGGPLQSGALPQVKADTQAGQQAILQALQEKDERVSKPKKVKAKEGGFSRNGGAKDHYTVRLSEQKPNRIYTSFKIALSTRFQE